MFFSFLNQNIYCGYSKELSKRDGSLEHPKLIDKLMGKRIISILRSKSFFYTYGHKVQKAT